ncbi:dynein heavy chain [Pyrenophora seminiperda CCB06]|uniref:Chloride channel protein n=1 Tax=Pyrenophora seminiperda CCB06 TaxID=1302712 RepID=A0A3M7M8D5_9PLEO|nr:dynein heavy chain [Pyrenophora seminiperda CCB06]
MWRRRRYNIGQSDCKIPVLFDDAMNTSSESGSRARRVSQSQSQSQGQTIGKGKGRGDGVGEQQQWKSQRTVRSDELSSPVNPYPPRPQSIRSQSSRPGRQASRSASHASSLRRRTTGQNLSLNSDDSDPEAANVTHTDAAIVEEIAEIKRYEDFTTIDWVQDAAREQLRRKARRRARDSIGVRKDRGGRVFLGRGRGKWRRKIAEAYDAGQAWIVVTLVGAAIGLNAAFLNIVTEWLSDIKLGHCSTAFYLNENFCCWGAEGGCPEWKRWTGFGLLVKSFAPYAAGSGISEMKCIIAGFVMKGFLGFTTLFIKSIGLPLAIGSGLSVGKEGPSVHYAVCTGNVISRFFDKYRRNAAKTREILSASAAAGVGVAFGSPIGGVLFSLEEMSNQFPLKTLWRSYFCALVATAVLAAMNPFRTGQLVMFNVKYDRSWHFFETVFYILIGVFGGLYGAFVIKWNLKMQVFRKKYLAAYPITEAVTLAVITGMICYPNMFLRIDMTESMEILFQECKGGKDYDALCDQHHKWHNIGTLAVATVVRTLLVVISFGCKVPAGIFVPSMAIGAAFGRMVGICVQALHEAFPTSAFFSACEPDVACITPGTYAFLGAAAALSGIMHITVSVVVIMFEITGALTYILPTMIVVGVTKAVSERFGHGGIADRMIYLNGYPFLDSKEEHTFGVPVSQVMETRPVCLPASGMELGQMERLVTENQYQGYPIVEDMQSKTLVGYIGRTELRYAIDRAKIEQQAPGHAKCSFTNSPPFSSSTLAQQQPPNTTSFDSTPATATATQASLDFTRYMDPHAPLRPPPPSARNVILIEYRGRLTGLVTIKDCLKYQFKVEAGGGGGHAGGAAAGAGDDDARMERLAGWGTAIVNWGRRKVGLKEVGEVRLGEGDGHVRAREGDGHGLGHGEREEDDDEAFRRDVELVDRRAPNGSIRTPSPSPPSIDPQIIVDHLGKVLDVSLGASQQDLYAPGSLLSQAKLQDTLQRCTRFASEGQSVLYVVKDRVDEPRIDGTDGTNGVTQHFSYTLSSEITASPTCAAFVVISKRPIPIDPAIPLSQQVLIQTLPGFILSNNASSPDGTPYEFLRSLIQSAVEPYFDTYTKSQRDLAGKYSKGDNDARTGISATRKKIAELAVSLGNLEQNVEIPELLLPLHPLIQSALDDATQRGVKPSPELIPAAIVQDSSFLNGLQATVNGWIKSIQTITKTSRDVSTGTAAQEINFWISMESRLHDIETQLGSPGVRLTLDVLKNAKRFQATVSFSADTGLKESTDLVQKYNQLMREFPLDQLLSSTSLQAVQEAVQSIFSHMNKKLRICPYPVRRALPLVEAISGDLDKQLHNLLHGKTLMHMDYPEFQAIMAVAESIWRTWEENVKEFTNVAREVTRRRNEKFIPIKIAARHKETEERIRYITTFRKNHEQLQRTIVNVLGSGSSMSDSSTAKEAVIIEEIGDVDAVKEVKEAYDVLKDVDVLDVSAEGTRLFEQAEQKYNERTSRVENSIIARLRDRLGTAKTASEMFRVFSKFNPLFVRPKIRGAISEYQTQLIENVKQDILALHERFKRQYGNSEAHAMAQLRDFPPVSGAVIWARQIETQLESYMGKVEDILGKDWALHAEGQKLQAESSMFKKKLDTRPIFESWLQEVARRKLSISGRLFLVSRNRAAGNILELNVNFDAQVIALFKEVRNLTWRGYQVPHGINNISKEAKRVYPYAVSLMESVRTYTQTVRSISEMGGVALLLNGYVNDVQALVGKGVPLKWESFVHAYDLHVRQSGFPVGGGSVRSESKHVQFVRDFAAATSLLQLKVVTLVNINAAVEKALKDLETCPYTKDAFQQNLETIQKSIDQLNLENYANLSSWVSDMNARIESILLVRLSRAIALWIEVFNNSSDEEGHRRQPSNEPVSTELPEMKPTLARLTLEITMRNQVIYLSPPVEYARASWLEQLQQWLAIICTLQKIKASRYEIRLEATSDTSVSQFSDLPSRCTESLIEVYGAVEGKLRDISSYVDEWLQFQSLWDLQSEHVYDILGEDLSRWLQLLQEIRKTRATFDNSDISRQFGYVTVDYDQVQVKVNAKYDQWQQEILTKFASRLGQRMHDVYVQIEKARKDLEMQTLEASSTAQAVSFITTVQQCKRKVMEWEPEMSTFRQGQATLARQRYQFPADWLQMEQIDHEWQTLNEVLERKTKIANDQADALCAKIAAEDKVVNQKIMDITGEWAEEKPVAGDLAPADASAILAKFDQKLSQLQNESSNISKAKEALGLPASPENTLVTLLEEVQDFKSVWSALGTIWASIDDLREVLWTSIQPRKLRQNLDNLLKMTKDMPSRMRQYQAFEYVQTTLKQLLKENAILAELRSDAVKERHWARIFKNLRPQKRYSAISMTLGDVWELKLGPSEKIIRDVITQAAGEMALEEFLKQVRETWQNYALELVNYQNKCRLIRGWDDLFAKCSENLNSLQAMRHSPYYKEFEEEASSWEDKLNRVHVLFDVWIDVQRQWVYLEGVFTGNADIKHLLPMESARFQNINSEFLSVMKKVSRQPFVLEVLNISGVQKSLERLAELLNKIQKALGEYLERERVSFPRFYFVGDEDLLEIIGNSNDVLRIAKHLRKMFAGVSGLITDEDGVIQGFTSKEGEEVTLRKEISLVKTPRINEWLGALEANMKTTLAELTFEAYEEFAQLIEPEDMDPDAFHNYIAKYPTQVVVLGTQIAWTHAVEKSLAEEGTSLPHLYEKQVKVLKLLATAVLGDLEPIQRRKCEDLITEFVHQRDVIHKLDKVGARSPTHHMWLLCMRYVYEPGNDLLQRLRIKMANAVLDYGFEYLGVADRLALCQRLGGSPYGPAGTGKTESVKALGVQLGRFTLVFCCDDTFDFQAMGRIFLGICQVGAWGCFDEFNRLEERILSAVSQQIQNIQLGLKKGAEDEKSQIELIGRQLKVNGNTGVFITMNPGYAGRSNLPDNLKKLFRSVAMSKPDKELIAEVMLYSQGFSQAKELSKQVVPFFDRCSAGLSKQAHYDFGLRALKSVLVSSGGLKRARIAAQQDSQSLDEASMEPQIIIQSLRETMAPKLIRSDVELMMAIQETSFPGVMYIPAPLDKLTEAIHKCAAESKLVVSDAWMTKIIQLYQIQKLHHGVMMVGSSGSGKSAAWRTLISALQAVEGVEGVWHVIDPKVMSKEQLYGTLDSTTREWTDGLFTHTLRKIVDNLRGEDSKRHWIVFDGDVDPEWVENLNSVLDDNKLLTLPNGERLNLPSNVRIMFEVETLKYATLATVSRCGMVWFSDDTVEVDMMIKNYIEHLKTVPFEDIEDDSVAPGQQSQKTMATQGLIADFLHIKLTQDRFIEKALSMARKFKHIMEYTDIRALNTLFSLLNKACRNVLEYNVQHPDFSLEDDKMETYLAKKMLVALVWALVGDCPLLERKQFGDLIAGLTDVELPTLNESTSLIDYDVKPDKPDWDTWQSQVPHVEVNTHSVTQTDVVIPTLDTVRHEDVLYSWLAEHKPLLLCGPPGSGKTMTLFSALRKLPNMQVVGLNFSSATTPDLLIKTFEQYCEYKKTLNGVQLTPTQVGRWLVIFCDEINLPAPDKYGTQRAISFLRQLVEHNGFWRTSDKTWVSLDRIQFVGACNPPTDAGRTPMGLRFLRHAPLIMVDYPGEQSLLQIYGTFNTAVLKIIPTLRGYADALTKAMVQLFAESQKRFTPDIQPHYVYSPRELTRWVRGIYEALRPLETLPVEGLVRIWAHEALRLFQDRLIAEEERQWTEECVHRHLILIGVSGSGKTTLSRFVAWMNGLSVYQIKVHGKYSGEDFDEDLRTVLRRCGCKGEKICFIMDEANVLDSGFLERMNTLLANAEVPGLFEGDEYASLLTAIKEGAQRQGIILDSQEELYKWFTEQIVKNLHVVFTMNPPEEGLSSKAATSPALFNRCVLNWFGDWSDQALYQVSSELTQSVDLDRANYVAPDSIPVAYRGLSLPPSHRESVVNAMVAVHHSLRSKNAKLQKTQNRKMYLTPRHFLDFVAQYVKLYNEKREDLEEQQRHLNVGLEKLRETFDKVKELRASLAEKQTQLTKKDAEANEKLQRMIADQNEAEQKKAASIKMQARLAKDKEEIQKRRAVVEHDLAAAEPAVVEAQKSVQNIKRQHLTEVRSMQNPPAGVKLALEAVCTILGHKPDSWKTIVSIVRRDDFIASIVQFDNERQMTAGHRRKMQNEYLSKEEFTFEKVNRASKACGPLVQWVSAQVTYSDILDRVGPLRAEVENLQVELQKTEEGAKETQILIQNLENSIGRYKTEYAALISETQAIKTEMSTVQFKVDRSVRLLDSLSSERTRWEESSKSFDSQIDTIVGDVLVAAAFIAYAGYYDQQYRKALTEDWYDHLKHSGISFKPTNPFTEYLSNADDRLNWQHNGLPVDDLCTENAIILQRFNRYPLIIDPSARTTEFLQNECKDRRLTVTSFLDDSFTKQLESSLRFGNPILIQDAEHLDPILNHVLNKEYQKTGGRVLIQLGKQEIDFSPSFRLYLSTRDPSANFPPDICSRTTFVNFTVTQSSLQTQTLNEVLKSERPDVDERRSNLIKMQGEFAVHLRQLEKRLLQALNESRGNILDDDRVIETLETLKKEAKDISDKVSETAGVMTEVENITKEYTVVARSCSAIFAVLEQLHHLNHFYQFSLQYFTQIFEAVLRKIRNSSIVGHAARIEQIITELFVDAYRRTSLSLLQKDRVTFAMLLVQAAPYKMDKSHIDQILDPDLIGIDVSTQTDRKEEAMQRASKIPMFKDALEKIEESAWDSFLTEEMGERYVPQAWPDDLAKFDKLLRALVLVKLFRVDRFVPAVERFVTEVFGKGILDASGDLGDIVKQVNAVTPVALSSSPGFDASYKVDNLVERENVSCSNIAMGSNEGAASADKAIANAATTGSWVLVKNVHLAPQWLQSLEKRLEALKPNPDFRLFLSMESSPKIPVNLLRASRVLSYEQPAGVRANMRDSLSSLAEKAIKPPVEKARVYLLLSFLHAVIQERLRYAPTLGWKGFWEFNDSDYECCSFIIDTWVDTVAQGRSNIAPTKIPWEMLRILITEMYGGKIDDAEDWSILASLVDACMTPAAFEDKFMIVKETEHSEGLELPSSTSWKDFMGWVNDLPEREPPTYLGLPANAEKLLLVGQANNMVGGLKKVIEMLDEGEHVMAEAEVEA